MTTATEVVVQCENVLGFTHTISPLYRGRAIEAGKIKKKLKTTPGVTLDDLLLAIEYCRRRREPVKSPVALFWRVDDARQLANEAKSTSDVSTDVGSAMTWELEQQEVSEYWVGRLTRAHGPHRESVLAEWKGAGRGPA